MTVVQAKEKAVYAPEDNRLNIEEVLSPLLRDYARATLAKVDKSSLIPLGEDSFELIGFKLGVSRHMCTDERFFDEIMAVSCTGFLIGDDLVATAGHCLSHSESCNDDLWIFDFTNNTKVKKENIYKCKEVVMRVLDRDKRIDYAVIRLQKKTIDRPILSLREVGEPLMDDELALLGHPSGLPLKIARGGRIRDLSADNYITTTLDAFHGNSGSPVINMRTGLVEGILVEGEDDYEIDYVNNCRRVKVCNRGECRGEDITRATLISQELLKMGLK